MEAIHPIINQPHTHELVGFYWHMCQDDFSSTYIELDFEKNGSTQKLRFTMPVEVKIENGFYGNLSGMAIYDISSQQLDRISVEVRNFEQDAGITFKAAMVAVVE